MTLDARPGREQVGHFQLRRSQPTSQRRDSQVTPASFALPARTTTRIEEGSSAVRPVQHDGFTVHQQADEADNADQPAKLTVAGSQTNGYIECKTTVLSAVEGLNASLGRLSVGKRTTTSPGMLANTTQTMQTGQTRSIENGTGAGSSFYPRSFNGVVGGAMASGVQPSISTTSITAANAEPPLSPAGSPPMTTMSVGPSTANISRRQNVGRRAKREDSGVYAPNQSGRKNRTVFSEEQHNALLAAYEADKYPTTIQKELLARQLGIPPIVVINWFQHRRQREPVKEKGGYVRNHSKPADTANFFANLGIQIPSLPRNRHATPGPGIKGFPRPPNYEPGRRSTLHFRYPTGPSPPAPSPSSTTTITTAATTITAGTSPSPSPSPSPNNGIRIVLESANDVNQNRNPDQVPKSANAHIGPLRWDLDPLYIAPYVDHAFTGAHTFPKERFVLKPCLHMPEEQEPEPT